MKLKDIYPQDLVENKVNLDDVTFHQFGMEKIDEIVRIKKSCMFELGGTIWDKYIQTTPDVNPMSLATHFQNSNPYLFEEASKIIGEKTIQDISYTYAEVNDSAVEHKIFSQLLVAVLHKGILHISDVEFSHPLYEIPEKDRKFTFQTHKGLGLFDDLIFNGVAFCEQEGLNKICLTAANIDLVQFFEKYDFSVDDTPTGRFGMEHGGSIPMSKIL